MSIRTHSLYDTNVYRPSQCNLIASICDRFIQFNLENHML